MIHTAVKCRAYPNKELEQKLVQAFGCRRYVWNRQVKHFNDWDPNTKEELPSLTEHCLEKPWLALPPRCALQAVEIDFAEMRKQFFDKKRKIKLGRPKFKIKGKSKDSFRISNQANFKEHRIDKVKGMLNLPNFGDMKVVYPKNFPSYTQDKEDMTQPYMLSYTVSRNKAGEYYVSFLFRAPDKTPFQKTGKEVGIDLGILTLATLSDGTKFDNMRLMNRFKRELAHAQRMFAKKKVHTETLEDGRTIKVESRERRKWRIKVAKIYQKMTRIREWYFHQISLFLVKNFDLISLEDLNIKGMMKNRRLSRAIQDCAWFSLIAKIKYKAAWYGKEVVQVGRFFASSKICSGCGHRADKMPLDMREWICAECGSIHDRDANAARNILAKGKNP